MKAIGATIAACALSVLMSCCVCQAQTSDQGTPPSASPATSQQTNDSGSKDSSSPQSSSANDSSATDTASADTPKRVVLHQEESQGLLIHKVVPVYRKKARKKDIQGTVVLEAIISKEGTIKDLHPVSGPPELTDAAMKAVKQWRYKPYLLDGEPVEVETTINVNFVLEPQQ